MALVTGGGRRIGAAVARSLAGAGHFVVATWRRSRGEASSPAAETGGSARRLDLAAPPGPGRFAAAFARDHRREGLLVHDAAAFPRGPVGRLTPASRDGAWERLRAGKRRTGLDSPRPSPAPSCGSRAAGDIISPDSR